MIDDTLPLATSIHINAPSLLQISIYQCHYSHVTADGTHNISLVWGDTPYLLTTCTHMTVLTRGLLWGGTPYLLTTCTHMTVLTRGLLWGDTPYLLTTCTLMTVLTRGLLLPAQNTDLFEVFCIKIVLYCFNLVQYYFILTKYCFIV